MKNVFKIAVVLLGLIFASHAMAQTGQLQAGQIWGNPASTQKPATGTTVGAILDQSYSCNAQGDIIFRGSSLWTCLAPGTSGLPLVSQGAGANLHYAALANAGLVNSSITIGSTTISLGSTVTTVAGLTLTSPTFTTPTLGVAQGTSLALGGCTIGANVFCAGTSAIVGLTVTTSFTATGLVTYADMATAALATQAQYFAATVNTLVPTSVAFTSEITITFSATQTIDFSTFINSAITLTANMTSMTLSNVKAGQAGQIRFIQDGTGSRLFSGTWPSTFKFSNGATPTLSTAAGAVDALEYNCTSSSYCVASLIQNVK
jgi:hypothetical protein